LIVDRINYDDYEKVLVLSDVHIPYQDNEKVNAVITFISTYEPHKIILNGDIIDFPQISRFSKNLVELPRLKDDLIQTIELLKRIRDTAGDSTEIWYLGGNHEFRLHKFLIDKCVELSGLDCLKFEQLLQLDDMNISYVPYGKGLEYKNVLFEHGYLISKFAGYTAKNQFESRRMCGVSSHTHRLAKYRHNNYQGQQFWIESGCICDFNAEYINGLPNWQNGFAYLLFDDENCVNAEVVEL
jgi:UDP-2,3-diacylglucosamine pyrophosphatase LpxH